MNLSNEGTTLRSGLRRTMFAHALSSLPHRKISSRGDDVPRESSRRRPSTLFPTVTSS